MEERIMKKATRQLFTILLAASLTTGFAVTSQAEEGEK